MDIQKLKDIIAQNMTLSPNDDFEQEKCWNEMTNILSANIQKTMEYFSTDCTDEELFWLGAVFEDVAENTHSKEFIQVLRNRLAKVLPENYHQQNFKSKHMQNHVDYTEYMRSLSSDIEFAEGKLNVQ